VSIVYSTVQYSTVTLVYLSGGFLPHDGMCYDNSVSPSVSHSHGLCQKVKYTNILHQTFYIVGHKNVAIFLQQLLQILTDFDNFCITLTRNE